MRNRLNRIFHSICTYFKQFSVFDYIITVCAVFTFIMYAFYIRGGTFITDSGGIFVSLFVILGTTLPLAFRKFLKRLLKKAYKPVKIIYAVGLIFYTLTFSAFSIFIITDSDKEIRYDDRQTVVLVCGCKVNGTEPSRTLGNRLRKAKEILDECPDAICIVAGGQGSNEPVTESSVMKRYLVYWGIDEGRIYEEDKSTDTVENLRFSAKILEELGIDKNCNLICVSSDAHTTRVSLLAKDMGFDAQTASAPSPYLYLYVSSLVREYMSFAKYYLIG